MNKETLNSQNEHPVIQTRKNEKTSESIYSNSPRKTFQADQNLLLQNTDKK